MILSLKFPKRQAIVFTPVSYRNFGCRRGGMADALRSGRSPFTRVEVQVLSSAPLFLLGSSVFPFLPRFTRLSPSFADTVSLHAPGIPMLPLKVTSINWNPAVFRIQANPDWEDFRWLRFQVATLKSSCIVLFACLLKTHPAELIEVPSMIAARTQCVCGQLDLIQTWRRIRIFDFF